MFLKRLAISPCVTNQRPAADQLDSVGACEVEVHPSSGGLGLLPLGGPAAAQAA